MLTFLPVSWGGRSTTTPLRSGPPELQLTSQSTGNSKFLAVRQALLAYATRPRRHNRASSQATPPTSLRAFKPPQALTKLQPSSKEQGKRHTAQLRGVPPLASACPDSPSLDQLRCPPAIATAGPAKTSPMAWPRLSREIMSRQGNFPINAK